MRRLIIDLLRLARQHRRALIRLVLAGSVAGVLVSIGGFYFSSQPWFCNSCHYMRPYVKNWKASKHSGIACPTCHFSHDPVKLIKQKSHAMATTIRYFVGTYDRRPKAEVGDEMCLQKGCHDTRLLSGKATFKRGIIFDHKDHLTQERRGIKLRCTSCHSQIVQGNHISVTESVCFTCHFRNTPDGHPLGGCGNCHGAPKGPINHKGFTFDHAKYVAQGVACEKCHIRVTRGNGAVPPDRCYSCHMERDRQQYDKKTIHVTHVTEHKVECFECHEPITHGLVEVTQNLDMSCGECHHSQRDLFVGTGISQVPDMPSTMMLGRVGCESCHHTPNKQHPGKADRAAVQQTCVDCHGKGYDKVLDDWRTTADDGCKTTDGLLAQLDEALSSAQNLSKEDREKIDAMAAGIRASLKILRDGGAFHNIGYALSFFETARKDILDALERLGRKPDAPPFATKNPKLVSCIKTCHVGFGHNSTVTFDGGGFPHERHVDQKGITCEMCHQNNVKHGTMVATKEACSSCHHKSARECSTCHTLQAAMLAGKGDGKKIPTMAQRPGEMSDGVPCEGCHTEQAKPDAPPKAVPAACDACHKKGTGPMTVALWQSSTRKLHKAGVDRLAQVEQNPAAKDSPALQGARARLDTIRRDGSWGVHNKNMVDTLLQEADSLLDQVAQPAETRHTEGEGK